jgi:hypothetical protein
MPLTRASTMCDVNLQPSVAEWQALSCEMVLIGGFGGLPEPDCLLNSFGFDAFAVVGGEISKNFFTSG